jgi:hypothetical protein
MMNRCQNLLSSSTCAATFRLYCEDAMQSLDPHIKPELLRTNLGGVVLQLKALGVLRTSTWAVNGARNTLRLNAHTDAWTLSAVAYRPLYFRIGSYHRWRACWICGFPSIHRQSSACSQ